MIGLFKVTNKRDGSRYVDAQSCMTPSIEGRFYIPFEYRDAVSTLSNGDDFFGVMDDATGFGAMLYKVDDGLTTSTSAKFANDVNVSKTVNADTVSANTVKTKLAQADTVTTSALTGPSGMPAFVTVPIEGVPTQIPVTLV